MKSFLRIAAGLAVLAAVVGVLVYLNFGRLVQPLGRVVNYVRTWSAPPGRTMTEVAAATTDDPSMQSLVALPADVSGDWPSYNKTLTSARYASLNQINTQNVGTLKVQCVYDTKQYV